MEWVVNATPRLLYPQGKTHFIGGWVGPRDSPDGVQETPPLGFDPRTVQPIASHYTD
jgi:hypothetical protein